MYLCRPIMRAVHDDIHERMAFESMIVRQGRDG